MVVEFINPAITGPTGRKLPLLGEMLVGKMLLVLLMVRLWFSATTTLSFQLTGGLISTIGILLAKRPTKEQIVMMMVSSLLIVLTDGFGHQPITG